jgi:hypothetical protein
MAIIDVNLLTDLDIHSFSGSGITDYEAGTTNCIVHTRNGKNKLTQRPSIDISEDASTLSTPPSHDRARGIYYWEQNSKLYIVNDNDVFASTQDSTRLSETAGTFPSGSERVTILETIGVPRLIILDAENDEGWVMGTVETLTQIASNFPTTLCHGGAVLDGYLFVMDEDGTVYNSDIDDPTIFGATAFITSERQRDKGVYLGKHHDHLSAFGTRTIEFFYDNQNTTGSPLNRRQDISYNIGCPSGLSVWENGDITYFLGSKETGQIQIYKLQNFQITPVSADSLNSYLTQGLTQESLKVVMEGVAAMGHDILIMTVYTLTGASPGEIVPKQTIILDTATGFWGFWDTDLDGLNYFPLIAGTKRTGGQNETVSARTWEGIMYNGDIVNINDKLVPIDTLLGSEGVYEADVYEPDVYEGSSASNGTNIPIIIRTGNQNGGTDNYKFQERLNVLMESTSSAQTMTIKKADEGASTFTSLGTIDTSKNKKQKYSQGRFVNRNFQLEYSGDEQFFIEAFQAEGELGT